jgi:hypothetical protein
MRFPRNEWNNALKYYQPISKQFEEKENKSHSIDTEIKS